MNSSQILSLITFIYGLGACLYIASWVFRKDQWANWGKWVAILGLVGNIAGFLLRWKESYSLGFGHIPLSNLYESLVFFGLTIVAIYLVVEKTYRWPAIGAFVLPLAFFSMAYASLSGNISSKIQPLIPALKSNWLTAHVMTCFVAYASFAIAFGISVLYLTKLGNSGGQKSEKKSSRMPNPKTLDELTQQMVMFGFLFLTAGIITGAVWANSAWGRYWGWDPKETWSLITWLVYAALLHFRLMRGWSGNRIALFSIIGFMAVMFTYFGVNYLPGLHSYGSN